MRIALILTILLALVLALVLYVPIDLVAFLRPSGDGPMLGLSLLLGMIGDIVVIGVLVAYLVQKAEQKKWEGMSRNLAHAIANDVTDLIHAEELFTVDVLDFNSEYIDIKEKGLPVEYWRGLFARANHLNMQAAEITAICQTLSQTISLFPIQYADNPKRLVALGVAAAQVSNQSVMRASGLITLQAVNLGTDNEDLIGTMGEFTEAGISLYDRLYDQVQNLYAKLIEFGAFAPSNLRPSFEEEKTLRNYIENVLLGKAIAHATSQFGPNLIAAWRKLIESYCELGYADEAMIQAHIQELEGPRRLVLWEGTKRQKLFHSDSAPSSA